MLIFRLCFEMITRRATFSRNNLKTLCENTFNSLLPHLFATKIDVNESWIMFEHSYLSVSRKEAISRQNLSFLLVVSSEFFVAPAARSKHHAKASL